jgi:hypothetical protein
MALYVVKTVLELTREEAAEIALRFPELLENPDVTKISLFSCTRTLIQGGCATQVN